MQLPGASAVWQSLTLSYYLWNLGGQEIFCKKLVVVDVGNEISVAVTGKGTLRDRAERCECAGQGGNTPGSFAKQVFIEIAGQQHWGPGSKGQGLMGWERGDAVDMQTPCNLA